MLKSKSRFAIRYTVEFRRQMVELVRAGRKPSELSREFGCTSWSINRWVAQAERDAGDGGLAPVEREELVRLRREVKQLRVEREILSKAAAWFAHRPEFEARFGFVKANQACHPVAPMCRFLEVPKISYYAWRKRPRSRRAVEDIALTAKIEAIHRRSGGTYGSPRVHAQLRADGVQVSRKRVTRLLRRAGLQGVSRRRFVTTTQRDHDARPAPDLVKRHFQAPDRLWVADITYIPTGTGFLYLAIVLDVFSRRIVGWAMEAHLRTELVLMALDRAFAQRCPKEVIHHSDQGTQYTSVGFGSRCREMGVQPSMGSVGDCFDNAMAESFFASLECELLARHRFKTQAEAKMAVFEYIEGFYNPHRLHSAIGYLSPVNFERRNITQNSLT